MTKERQLPPPQAQRVTFLMGSFGALGLCVLMFVFLWNFWLKEVFSPAERISLSQFVGSDYQRILDGTELASMYRFEVVYVINTETESGTVLSQNPDPGRSMMITPDGIKVELSVSTGKVFNPVPDVINLDYREAKNRLQKAGFIADIENATSSTVTKDYVISTSPMAGEQMSSGSTVYVVVSTGPQTSYIRMPNVIGLSEEAAIVQTGERRIELRRVRSRQQRRRRRHSDRTERPGAFTELRALQNHLKISLGPSTEGRRMIEGIIVKALSGFYYVAAEDRLLECKARGRFRLDGSSPLVGDRVLCSQDPDGKGRIDDVKERKNWFIRPAVANIDTLVFVGSQHQSGHRPFLIDHVSVIAAEAGMRAGGLYQQDRSRPRRHTVGNLHIGWLSRRSHQR